LLSPVYPPAALLKPLEPLLLLLLLLLLPL
jgi:hypothetical protein